MYPVLMVSIVYKGCSVLGALGVSSAYGVSIVYKGSSVIGA